MAGASVPACDRVECAEGTVERAGQCEPADQQPGSAACGPGTRLGASGLCEPILPPAVCDPESTDEIVDPDTGVIVCQGTGAAGCAASLPDCTEAPPGTMTLCGRILDLQTDAPVQAAGATGAACTPGATAAPCALRVLPYNAIAFASNPQGATPLPVVENYLDDCGRFRLRQVAVEASVPFVGLAVDDRADANAVRTTAVALARADASGVRNIVAYSMRNATDQAWTTSAALAGGTFADQGVYAILFRRLGTPANPLAGAPIRNVVATRAGTAFPDDDYYFSDAGSSSRATVDPALSATGANGTALLLRSTLGPHSGAGGIPASCRFGTYNGASVPGVAFVQISPAQDSPGMACSFP